MGGNIAHVATRSTFPLGSDTLFLALVSGRLQICNIKKMLDGNLKILALEVAIARYSVYLGRNVYVFEKEL